MSYPTSWNLSRYFYSGLDDPKLSEDIKNIMPTTEAFAKKYSEKFRTFTKPAEILEFYTDYTKLSYDMAKPSYYLFYLSSLDTQNLEVTKKMGEVDYIYTEASNLLLFVAQGWKDIGYDRIMEWSRDPLLEKYNNDLIWTADGIRYILWEKEEYVLNLKSRPLGLANSLHDELTGSYEFTMNIGWEEKKMTEEEVRSYRQHTDRNIRREAYASLRRVYNSKQNQITLGNIYTSIVKDWSTEIKMRKYPDNVMAQRNLSEEMDDEVVNMLLSEVERAYPIYTRYLKAKAKMLGLETNCISHREERRDPENKKGIPNSDWIASQARNVWVAETFSIWDTGAPIGHSDKDFTFDEAYDLHLSVMQDFDADFYEYSKRMIEEERIDVFPRAGKRWWAFASYRKGDESFVLLNFTGKLRDVSTISHELWHAIHGHLSQVQEAPVYDSPLSMAETASIFSEMLLGEKVKSMVSTEEYKDYLNERLSDIFATIFRQVQYVIFERKVHEIIHTWQEVTYKELNSMWRAEQEKLYGDTVAYDVEGEEESGWSMIPHIFHTPFYCYAYAFGNLLTFALYHKVHVEQSLSIEDYKDILRAWGSERPRDLLKKYGIDIASPEFYRAGLLEVEHMVEEFEKLV
jgi:oligoendopeptidase F